MRKTLKGLSSLFLLLFLVVACEKKSIIDDIVPHPEDQQHVPKDQQHVQKVNRFIVNTLKEAYLWSDDIQWENVDPKKEVDSKEFFLKLKNKEDRWSRLTDNQQQLNQSFQGIVTTYGYDLSFGTFANSKNIFGIVLYVYPNTPADKAGFKRGDVLIKINGTALTKDNYTEVLYSSSVRLKKAIFKDGTLKEIDQEYSMTAVEMYEDPIIDYRVIKKGAHKIGYLAYTDFTQKSEAQLERVFKKLKSQGVNEMVLDLRYNLGGYSSASQLLASILAPQDVVNRRALFVKQQYNKKATEMLRKKGKSLAIYISNKASVNLGIKRLFVLTSRRTASASESTIIGLMPYLDVVLVGDTTYGKFCGGPVYTPDKDKDIENWGIYLITHRFRNKDNFPYQLGGLVPDYLVKESIESIYPFGDERDPLLAKVIEVVTGVPAVELKSKGEFPVGERFYVEHRPLTNMMIDTDTPLSLLAE